MPITVIVEGQAHTLPADGGLRQIRTSSPSRFDHRDRACRIYFFDPARERVRIVYWTDRQISNFSNTPAIIQVDKKTGPWRPMSPYIRATLRPPDPPKLKTKKATKEKTMKNNQFEIGDRVSWGNNLGTVAGFGLKEGHPEAILVCLDYAQALLYNRHPELVGDNHGIFVSENELHVPCVDEKYYENIPAHVGVTPYEDFKETGVWFSGNLSIGRIKEVLPIERTAIVEWQNVFRKAGSQAAKFEWAVSYEKLCWCIYNPNTFETIAIWDSVNPKSSTLSVCGDSPFLVYIGNSPIRVVSGPGGYSLTAGGVVRHEKNHDSRHVDVEIVAGTPRCIWGTSLILKNSCLVPLKHPWVPFGAKVMVEEEILFRGKNLKGMPGLVLLPTDAEGDIGVQFKEDIEAGSLDGEGKEGRCLFIPSRAVKESS